MPLFQRSLLLVAASLLSIAAWAQPNDTDTTTSPMPAPAPTAPAAVAKPAPRPVVATPAPAQPTVVAPAAPVAPVMTLEQRHQQDLLANADRIDKANRDLLAKNQELQLQNENLGIQVNVLQKDRSSEGIRNGAIAVIVGFFIGFFFSGTGGRRNKSGW